MELINFKVYSYISMDKCHRLTMSSLVSLMLLSAPSSVKVGPDVEVLFTETGGDGVGLP